MWNPSLYPENVYIENENNRSSVYYKGKAEKWQWLPAAALTRDEDTVTVQIPPELLQDTI